MRIVDIVKCYTTGYFGHEMPCQGCGLHHDCNGLVFFQPIYLNLPMGICTENPTKDLEQYVCVECAHNDCSGDTCADGCEFEEYDPTEDNCPVCNWAGYNAEKQYCGCCAKDPEYREYWDDSYHEHEDELYTTRKWYDIKPANVNID